MQSVVFVLRNYCLLILCIRLFYRYMALVLMIIGALAVATTVGWTLATLVKVDFSPGR